ncbi:hypothetical protein, partial [Bifidobacterium felsineum]|uniref:hypothetical protein n=1 Tax=Bifidobacterium felsineum TaxID=2045440 RepID=UPI001BDDA92C
QAFFVIHFFGRKTEYAGTPLTLTESTAQRRTDTHENNNSAIKIYHIVFRFNNYQLVTFLEMTPFLTDLIHSAN